MEPKVKTTEHQDGSVDVQIMAPVLEILGQSDIYPEEKPELQDQESE